MPISLVQLSRIWRAKDLCTGKISHKAGKLPSGQGKGVVVGKPEGGDTHCALWLFVLLDSVVCRRYRKARRHLSRPRADAWPVCTHSERVFLTWKHLFALRPVLSPADATERLYTVLEQWACRLRQTRSWEFHAQRVTSDICGILWNFCFLSGSPVWTQGKALTVCPLLYYPAWK